MSERPLRLILNVDAISAPLTGIGVYTRELALGLERAPQLAALRLFSAYRWVANSEQAFQVNRTIHIRISRLRNHRGSSRNGDNHFNDMTIVAANVQSNLYLQDPFKKFFYFFGFHSGGLGRLEPAGNYWYTVTVRTLL